MQSCRIVAEVRVALMVEESLLVGGPLAAKSKDTRFEVRIPHTAPNPTYSVLSTNAFATTPSLLCTHNFEIQFPSYAF